MKEGKGFVCLRGYLLMLGVKNYGYLLDLLGKILGFIVLGFIVLVFGLCDGFNLFNVSFCVV